MHLTKLRLILKINCEFCQKDLQHFFHVPREDIYQMVMKQEIVDHLNEKFFIQELDKILNEKICTDLRFYFFGYIQMFRK